MPPDLATLIAPAHTALVTSECQNGVLGEEAIFPELAAAATASGVVRNILRLADAARSAGIEVVHCLALRRSDAKGSNSNARLFAAAAKAPVALEPGTTASEIVAGLQAPSDLVLTRLHGLGPMAGTDLDPVLRNLGIRTIVVVGASINVALTNLVMDAVNAGYQVVVPRDAAVGIPAEYAAAVIDNTLSLLATITTSAAVADAWRGQT